MSLKILVFPIAVVLLLTLIIGYIKPDVISVLEKRKELDEKQVLLGKIDTVIQNIRSQHMSINERRESELLVMKYLPVSLEEERVLDTFNYLAAQAGVTVTNVAFQVNPTIRKEIPQLITVSDPLAVTAEAGAVSPVPLAETPTRAIESYRATVSVVGFYDNIKNFFTQLNRSDRFHDTQLFGIEERKEGEGTPADAEKTNDQVGFLKGTFEADFIHYQPMKAQVAFDQPLFQNNKFDFSTVDSLLNHIKSPLPTLEVGAAGKANPFQ